MPFDGEGFPRATLMQRRHAIIAVNYEAMKERTFSFVLKDLFKPGQEVTIPRDVITVFDMLIHSEAMDRASPFAEKLKERVCEAAECSRPKAQKMIELAESIGVMSRQKGGVHVINYFDPAQAARARTILNHLEVIPAVVAAQLADVFDKDAGSNLVPKEIYYNVIESYR